MAALAPGTLVARRYVVSRPVGEGATAIVFQARFLPGGDRAGEDVALKLYRGTEPDAAWREYEVARDATHPSLARALDVGRAGDTPFVAFEWAEGEDFDVALKGADPALVAEVVDAVAGGLSWLHSRGLVHGDIQPANVRVRIVEGRPSVRLLDLGFARPPGARGGGTPAYSAPEALEGCIAEGSDLFSLGVLAYEALCGRHPFAGDDAVGRLLRAEPSPMGPNVPGPLAAVVTRLLSRDASTRYRSAGALRAALRAAVPELPPATELPLAPPLVEREQAWGLLSGRIHHWSLGQGGLFRLGGPPGSGRSRLLSAASARARLARVQTCCVSASRGAAVLADLVDRAEEAGAAAASCEIARHRLAAGDGDSAGRLAGAAAVLPVLVEARARGPLLVIVDDLDLAGPTVRDAILFLARDDSVGWLLADADSPGIDGRLGPLGAEGVARMLSTIFPELASREIADALVGVGVVQPGQVVEVAARASAEGAIRFHAGAWRVSAEGASFSDLGRRAGVAREPSLALPPAICAELERALELAALGETEAACEGLFRAARRSRGGGDFDSTLALFERARELAGDGVLPAARAEEAELLVELGRKDAALAVLRPGEAGDAPLEDGELGRARGRVLARAGDYEGAAALLSKAGDERSDEDRLWLAWSLTMRGRYDEASALVAEPPRGDARLRARYGRVAGTIAWHRGRPDQAKLLLLEAREAAERCGDVRVRVEVEQSLATAEHLLGELANAARRYEEAATLCREAGLVVHLAKVLNNLAIVRYLAGEWDRAHDAWQSMHELAERLGAREEILLAHNNLGLLYSNRGELHRAEHSFGRALALAIAAGVPRYEAMVLGNRAEARTRAGDLVRASEDLARSRELSREVGATTELRECRRRGAALALARGETEWALEEARSAATEAADAGDALEAGSTWLLASAAARHLGRLDEAHAHLRTASDAIGAAGTRLEQALVRLEEARVLSAQGRHELAKSAARQAAAAFAELGAERELKEAREIEWGAQGTGRADAMFELLDAAASAPDAPALLQGVLERLVRISRAERGFVITLSSEHGPRVAARFAVAGDDGPPRLSRGIADRVMASRRALVIADIEDELDLASRQSVMSLGLRAALCAPLMQGETCLGLLYLDSQHGTELARLGTWALEGAAAVLAPALDRMVERERELERRALLQATAEEAIETLAGVDAALDMLDDTLDPERHRSLVARARQRCAQLVGRSDGLLTLLRVERDMASCVGEPVELRALLGAAVDVFGAEGGRIEVQIDESSGAVRADLDHLSPAIVRVVELVSEAAGSGGVVTVCARPAEVAAPSGELHEWRPGSTVGANFVWIEVQASCVAAPDELGGDHLHRIDRDGSTSALALRVVQRVVTALGGRLWLDQSRERVRVVMELEAAA